MQMWLGATSGEGEGWVCLSLVLQFQGKWFILSSMGHTCWREDGILFQMWVTACLPLHLFHSGETKFSWLLLCEGMVDSWQKIQY